MGMHTLKEIILELMGWSISITAVLMLLYYIDPDILYEVLWGPGAVIAWLIGFFHLNYTVLVKYRILQDRFYFKYFQPDYLAK